MEISGFDPPQLRLKIFELLPNLLYLDSTDIDGNEEEDDEGNTYTNDKNGLDDDVSDGDDELEDEEGEEEEEEDEDSDGEVETGTELSVLYDNGVVLQDDEEDEDYNEDASDDEDDEEEEDEGKII